MDLNPNPDSLPDLVARPIVALLRYNISPDKRTGLTMVEIFLFSFGGVEIRVVLRNSKKGSNPCGNISGMAVFTKALNENAFERTAKKCFALLDSGMRKDAKVQTGDFPTYVSIDLHDESECIAETWYKKWAIENEMSFGTNQGESNKRL